MYLRTISVTCLLALLPTVAGAAVDAAKLRQATPLPSLSFSVGFDVVEGLMISRNPQDQARQAAALQKSLSGGPDDAPRYLLLGRFQSKTNDPADARKSYAQAVASYKTLAAGKPDDASVLTGYGQALAEANNLTEAETVLRHTVQVAPRQARPWAALADVLVSASFAALLPPDWPRDGSRGLALSDFQKEVRQNPNGPNAVFKPTATQIARAQALLDEARNDYDKAIQVEPQAAIGYVARGGFRAVIEGLMPQVIIGLRPGSVALASVVKNMSGQISAPNAPALADFQQAAQAAPNDLPAVSMATLFEALALIAASPASPRTKDGVLDWNALPAARREPIDQDTAMLAHLAQSKDDVSAAQAAEMLGTIWFLLGRSKDAEDQFRLVVARDPQRQGAWDGLMGSLVSANRFSEAAALGDQRVKAHDDANARLTLAKLYDKLNQPAQMTAQVQAAIVDAPDDLTVSLTEAALLLRRSDDPAMMTKAREWLDRAGAIYQKNQTPDNWKNYAVIVSVYNALTGSETEARKQLAQVLSVDKDNKEAKQVLAALGPSETQLNRS